MAAPRVVNCPTCSAPLEWVPENRYRPFCSERCKLVDLGAWATESYRVPVQDQENDSDGSPDGEKQDSGSRISDLVTYKFTVDVFGEEFGVVYVSCFRTVAKLQLYENTRLKKARLVSLVSAMPV